MSLSLEPLGTDAFEGSGNIDALGIDPAGVGPAALVDIHTLLISGHGVTLGTFAREAALAVDTLCYPLTWAS